MFDSANAGTTGQAPNLFGEGEMVGATGKTLKIQVARNALLAELSVLAEAIEPKGPMPSSGYLLIEASCARLILRTAGPNNTLQCGVGADVIEAGRVCLPARKLYEIVRQSPSETIAVSGDRRFATLKCGAGRFKLNAISPDDFPEAPSAAESFTTIPCKVLLRLIRSSLFVAQRTGEGNHYALDSAQLTIGPEGARIIATDGYRLICVERADVNQNEPITLLIPRSGLSVISSVLDSSEGEAMIGLASNRLFASVGERRFSSVLIDRAYPDCEPLLSKTFNRHLTLDCRAFKEAIGRMAVFGADGDERNFGVIKFHFAPDKYEFLSLGGSGGEGGEEIIPLSSTVSAETTISFNGRHLRDFARTLAGSELTISYNDENSPVEIRPAADEGYITRYILMPCRK